MTICMTFLALLGGDPPIILFIIAMVGDTIILTTALMMGVIHG